MRRKLEVFSKAQQCRPVVIASTPRRIVTGEVAMTAKVLTYDLTQETKVHALNEQFIRVLICGKTPLITVDSRKEEKRPFVSMVMRDRQLSRVAEGTRREAHSTGPPYVGSPSDRRARTPLPKTLASTPQVPSPPAKTQTGATALRYLSTFTFFYMITNIINFIDLPTGTEQYQL